MQTMRKNLGKYEMPFFLFSRNMWEQPRFQPFKKGVSRSLGKKSPRVSVRSYLRVNTPEKFIRRLLGFMSFTGAVKDRVENTKPVNLCFVR
jgi:hypothetical protein